MGSRCLAIQCRGEGKVGRPRPDISFGEFRGTFVIEDLHKLVEAGLPLQEVGGSRLSGFLFSRSNASVHGDRSIGDSRFDSFDADAQTQPPNRQFAEVEQGIGRSKRYSVITADVGR